MNTRKRFELVKQNTTEILTEQELMNLLEEKKELKAYWGTAPTGPFHLGHLTSLAKIFDFQKAKIETKILIANIHAALDDLKSPWEEIEKRANYYKKCIELAFPWEKKPSFVVGSEFQLKKEYIYDTLKISTLATITRAKRAASTVCRMKEPKVSELIYPIMQALDEQYLNVDIQLGGVDQRHIFVFAREFLPKIGYKARVEVMTPLIASIKGPGTKMSASLPETHIKIYDSVEKLKEKINKAYCPAGEIKDNPLIQICQFLIFPIRGKLKVERERKYGGTLVFNSFDQLKESFEKKELHPADLKLALIKELASLFKKARVYFEKHKDMLEELGKEFLS